jgi:hypothetical protein
VTPILESHKPGDVLEIEVRRGDERDKVQLKLDERPATSPFG